MNDPSVELQSPIAAGGTPCIAQWNELFDAVAEALRFNTVASAAEPVVAGTPPATGLRLRNAEPGQRDFHS